MSLDDINFPDINYGKKNKDLYDELTQAEYSPFFGCNYWEIFIFCMTYAYAKGLTPKEVPGTGSLPARVFQTETRDVMRALAIDYTGSLDIIKNSREYVKICEQFAYAGFDEIYKRITDKASETPVEDILMNLIKEIHGSEK
jgi:hypothetical protein